MKARSQPHLRSAMDREAISERMRTVAPRCIGGFVVSPAERPEPWEGTDIAVWRLACACGCRRGAFLGYPLSRFNAEYSGSAFVGPLGFKCAECGRVAEILDTKQHGYHAEACDMGSQSSGEGSRESFACPDCAGREFEVVASFFYWPASIDLVEDEPEEFGPRAQDLFCEFVAHGRCEKCGRVVRFTDFGKL